MVVLSLLNAVRPASAIAFSKASLSSGAWPLRPVLRGDPSGLDMLAWMTRSIGSCTSITYLLTIARPPGFSAFFSFGASSGLQEASLNEDSRMSLPPGMSPV